jgi:predicted Na+-dependent transporter
MIYLVSYLVVGLFVSGVLTVVFIQQDNDLIEDKAIKVIVWSILWIVLVPFIIVGIVWELLKKIWERLK